MNDNRERPLTINQWKKLRKTASDQRGLLPEVIADIVPFAALQANTLAHLREEWIQWRPDGVKIDIPATADCNSWMTDGTSGTGTLTRRNEPCNMCQTEGNTNKFERLSLVFDETNAEPRTVILHNKLAEPAVDRLEQIFKVRGRPELGCTTRGIEKSVRRLRDRTPFSRDFTIYSLIKTQIVIHAEYGLDFDKLCQLSLYDEWKVRSIITNAPRVTHDELRQDLSSYEFLLALDHHSPASVYDLMEPLNRSRKAIEKRLHHLKDRERVKIVKNEGHGPKPQLWSTTVSPEKDFKCQYTGCSYETQSLNGIKQHESRSHSQ